LENVIIFLSGALCGAIMYRGYTDVYSAAKSIGMFKITELYCLQLLALSLEDVTFLKESKRRAMTSLKFFNESQLRMAKNQDDLTTAKWKNNSIRDLISRYPENYKVTVKYSNWDTAMEWLNFNTHKVLDK
jgi:hypothetical protein